MAIAWALASEDMMDGKVDNEYEAVEEERLAHIVK